MKPQRPRAPRFGNYRVTKIAATPLHDAPLPTKSPEQPLGTWTTHWAIRPLDTPVGRILAVRRRGQELQVALLVKATQSLRWLPADQALTPKRAAQWLQSGAF